MSDAEEDIQIIDFSKEKVKKVKGKGVKKAKTGKSNHQIIVENPTLIDKYVKLNNIM